MKFKSLKVVFGRSNCLTLKQQTLAGLYFLSHLTLFDKLNCRDLQYSYRCVSPIQYSWHMKAVLFMHWVFCFWSFSLHCPSTTCISWKMEQWCQLNFTLKILISWSLKTCHWTLLDKVTSWLNNCFCGYISCWNFEYLAKCAAIWLERAKRLVVACDKLENHALIRRKRKGKVAWARRREGG